MSGSVGLPVVFTGLISHKKVDILLVQKRLGGGTYGTVYKAKTSIGEVAIKAGNHNFTAGIEASILREASAMIMLDHPFVVKLKDVFITQQSMNIVLPLGTQNLYDLTKQHKYRLPIPLVKIITWQILQAVCYIQSKDILHGDYKPENILLYPDTNCHEYVIKIADFGLAKTNRCYQMSAERPAFSLWYRPIEVSLGGEYTAKGDVWAIGCIVAEMLLGKGLFISDTDENHVANVFYKLGKPTESSWPGVSLLPHYEKYQKLEKFKGLDITLQGIDLNTRYSKHQGATSIPLDRPETMFLDRFLREDPHKRDSLTDILSDVWFEEVKSTLNLNCMKVPPLGSLDCQVALLNHQASIIKPSVVDYQDFSIFYIRFIGVRIRLTLDDRLVGLGIYIFEKAMETLLPDSEDDIYLYLLLSVFIANQLIGDTYGSIKKYIQKTGTVIEEKRDYYEFIYKIFERVGLDLYAATVYDVCVIYASIYDVKTKDAIMTILQLTYYTSISQNHSQKLIATMCVMMGCTFSGVKCKHTESLTKEEKEELTEMVLYFSNDLITLLNEYPEDRRDVLNASRRGMFPTINILRGIPHFKDKLTEEEPMDIVVEDK